MRDIWTHACLHCLSPCAISLPGDLKSLPHHLVQVQHTHPQSQQLRSPPHLCTLLILICSTCMCAWGHHRPSCCARWHMHRVQLGLQARRRFEIPARYLRAKVETALRPALPHTDDAGPVLQSLPKPVHYTRSRPGPKSRTCPPTHLPFWWRWLILFLYRGRRSEGGCRSQLATRAGCPGHSMKTLA